MRSTPATFGILSTHIQPLSRDTSLEKIKKYIQEPPASLKQERPMMHVVSVNPEILITARTDEIFNRIIETAQIQIVDGVGVVLAGQILHKAHLERYTGTDLTNELAEWAGIRRYPVLFIGGGEKIAQKLAECYSQKYLDGKYLGIRGIADIQNPTENEEKEIFAIVTKLKPRIVFVSFGSPWQELWLYKHRDKFPDTVCIGVGGAFNYLSGTVPRAPQPVRQIGLEWLHRLLTQPWRAKRQIKLVLFAILVGLQKIRGAKVS